MAWDDSGNDYSSFYSGDSNGFTFQPQAAPAPVDNSQANTQQGYTGDQADANTAAMQYNADNGYYIHSQLYNGLRERGVPTNTALGFIGGQLGESGKHLNPAAYNPNDNGSPSGGFAQWHLDRFDNLQKTAAERGTSWKDPNTQIAYYFKELDSPQYKGMMDKLRSGDSLNLGVKTSVYDYERPKDMAGQYAARLPMAQQLANSYSKGAFMTSDDGVNGMTNQSSPISVPSNTPFNANVTPQAPRLGPNIAGLGPIGGNSFMPVEQAIGGLTGGSSGGMGMPPAGAPPMGMAPSPGAMPTNAAPAVGAGDLLRTYGQRAPASPRDLGGFGFLRLLMAQHNQTS